MSDLKILSDIDCLQKKDNALHQSIEQKVTLDQLSSNINLKTDQTKIIAIESNGVVYNLLNNIDYTFAIDANGYLWVTYTADKGNVDPNPDTDTDTSVELSIIPDITYYEIGTIVDQISLSLTFHFDLQNIYKLSLYKDDKLLYEETDSSQLASNLLFEYNQPFTASTVFKAIIETNEKVIIKKKTIYFVNAIYYGVYHTLAYENDMLSHFDKALVYGKTLTAKFNPDKTQYLYFAIPSDLGDCTFTVNGFEGGFNKLSTIAYMNELNHNHNYDIYRSTYANLGITTVNLS